MAGTVSPFSADTALANDFAMVTQAAAFAADKHRDQRRRDDCASPYVNHPIALADVLAREGGIQNPIILAVALLHDTLEDTAATPDELTQAFGPTVSHLVRWLTDTPGLARDERRREQIERTAKMPMAAQMVRLADKICNLRDVRHSPPPSWGLERRQAYYDFAKQVVDQLRGTHAELERIFDEEFAARPEAIDRRAS